MYTPIPVVSSGSTVHLAVDAATTTSAMATVIAATSNSVSSPSM
jgi:hypothetical protein